MPARNHDKLCTLAGVLISAWSTLGCSGSTAAPTDAAPACNSDTAPRAWSSWVMPNPLASGLPNPASYALSEAGNVVTDGVTGLSWQRDVDTQSFSWDEAQHYCACLALAGANTWRLPSRIELASLVDWTTSNPSIDAQAFPATTNENFWTSSPVAIDPGLVYLVYFANGHTTYAATDYAYRARCVRGGAAAPATRYVLSDSVVEDTQTKLTWQRAIAPARYPQAEASQYCAALSLQGAGWRLPTIGELQTLVDETTNPSIDVAAFPQTPSEYFWSSSLVVDDRARAWTAFFTNGSTYSFALTAAKNVRCVR